MKKSEACGLKGFEAMNEERNKMDTILRDLHLHMVCGERRAFEEELLNAERYMAELIAENFAIREDLLDLVREHQESINES